MAGAAPALPLTTLSGVDLCQVTGSLMNDNDSQSETIELVALWLQKKKHVIHARNCLLQGGSKVMCHGGGNALKYCCLCGWWKVGDEGLDQGLGGFTRWLTGCNRM